MRSSSKFVFSLTLITVLILTGIGGAVSVGAQDTECPYQESPMLAEKVAAGELPSVCERLPTNPLVLEGDMMLPLEFVDPVIGVYGGEMVMTLHSGVDMKEPLFITKNRDPVIVAGNVIESLTWNDDSTEFTFTLREGHKWSDGEPMTTEDVGFAYEDVVKNSLLYADVPAFLKVGGVPDGEPAILEIVDETTFKFIFAAPYPAFTYNLVNIGTGYLDIIKPMHFLAKYHIDYGNADEIASMVADEGLTEWYELFNQVDLRGWAENSPQAIGFPQLGGWIRLESPEDRVLVERNPYYHAVDAAGNQLPYLDTRLTIPIAWTNPEAAELMMFSGQAHYHWNTDLSKLPLFKENEANGNYQTIIYPNKDSRMFFLNLTYDDPTWRQVTWDVRFRQALFLSMDKQELIDDLYYGAASLPTTEPSDYDPDAANALLDEMGMIDRDSDGFRLAPNGEPFEILIEVGAGAGGYKEQAPFLVDYFKAVGIRADFREIDDQLLGERKNGNEIQAGITWNTAPFWASHGVSPDYIPTVDWGPLWHDWYTTGGETGEEPPDWIKELYAIHEELVSYPWGSDGFYEQAELRDQWIFNNIPFFTFVENPGIAHLMSNCIGNVPTGPAFHHGTWTNHHLFYLKEECR